jgi:hypothetical protein
LVPIGCEEAHLTQKFIEREPQKLRDPGILQGSQAIAARFENRPEAPYQRNTEWALSIEEDPAGTGPAALVVSYF